MDGGTRVVCRKDQNTSTCFFCVLGYLNQLQTLTHFSGFLLLSLYWVGWK